MAKNTDVKSALGQLEGTLETYLVDKAPYTLPDNVKDIIVSFAPWASILLLLLAIPGILLVLGAGALVSPFAMFLGPRYAMSYGMTYLLSMGALAVSVVLEALAVPGLFKKSLGAWKLLYYAALVNLVSGVLGGSFVSAIVGSLIGLYFLFQVKSYYK